MIPIHKFSSDEVSIGLPQDIIFQNPIQDAGVVLEEKIQNPQELVLQELRPLQLSTIERRSLF